MEEHVCYYSFLLLRSTCPSLQQWCSLRRRCWISRNETPRHFWRRSLSRPRVGKTSTCPPVCGTSIAWQQRTMVHHMAMRDEHGCRTTVHASPPVADVPG